MHICFCFDVTDSELRQYIAEGHDTIHKIQTICGASTGCGMCYYDLVRILKEESEIGEQTNATDPEPEG